MKKTIAVLIFILYFIPLNTFAVTIQDEEEGVFISIYEKINPAIVSIDAYLPEGASSGTGCVVKPDGTILTSSHVVEGSKDIEVTIANGQVYKAKIITTKGVKDDLVLLKIKTDQPLKTITLANQDSIKVGQKVLTIGNPFGFSGSLTQGIVSRIDYTKNKIQTDAAINPGCSGGPLLNKNGEVIGINQSIYNPDNNISNIGIGFAIPVSLVKDFLDSNISK